SAVHRFFAPSMDPGDELVSLPRDEGQHLTRVLRLGVGDTVSVFDGRGREFLARVVSATAREVRVTLMSRVEPPTEATVAALMKGARLDRWRRVALASVKQSKRAILPEIRMPLTLETLIDEP